MAAHQKKSREEGAHIVLIDESGFFLNPLVRRTWAPKGRTPVMTGFGRHRDKVSTIAAISAAPMRRRIGLYFRTDPRTYVDAAAVASFLRHLLRHLRGKVVVVWDGGSNHKGPLIRELLRRYPRLHLERLPAYAPDLNPAEMVWSHLKYGKLTNFVPRDVRHLDRVVQEQLSELSLTPEKIKALWTGSRLPFPDTILAA
jgi:transposase